MHTVTHSDVQYTDVTAFLLALGVSGGNIGVISSKLTEGLRCRVSDCVQKV
jgi:hypothetical protein